jgi:hypothetical protein
MAAPAPRQVPVDEPRVAEAPTDPRAYQRELDLARRRRRARGRARIEHERELHRARIRFLLLLLTLLFVAALIGLSIWEKISALFGI